MSAPPPPTPAQLIGTRLRRASDAARGADLDAALITPGADLRYLIGATGASHERLTCLLLTAGGAPRLLVPALERPGYDDLPLAEVGVDVETYTDAEDPHARLAHVLDGARRVAVVESMPAAHLLPLHESLPKASLRLAGPVLRQLRIRKDAAEADELRTAAAAIDRVHARMADLLRVGRTEAQAAENIAAAIVAEGHTEAAFVIVGSGPNGASPHHERSERVVAPGDVVVVDIGGPLTSGYHSDCTRTYVMGEPAPGVAETYAVLQRAQAAAVHAVRPGVTAESVDAAARKIIADAGFGESFFHRTGHGIGLEVHEDPYIVAGNATPIEPGMAFSVEPGIYQAGRWGARIEDIVLVTDEGVESLNARPHELALLPA
jgi:Xaa-Pro dipeptidase